MKNRGVKLSNEYARAIRNFGTIPKSVFAAVAYAFASRIEETDDPKSIEFAIVREWRTLRDNRIVPQRVRIPRAVLKELEQRDLFPQETRPESGRESGFSTVSTDVHRSKPPV